MKDLVLFKLILLVILLSLDINCQSSDLKYDGIKLFNNYDAQYGMQYFKNDTYMKKDYSLSHFTIIAVRPKEKLLILLNNNSTKTEFNIVYNELVKLIGRKEDRSEDSGLSYSRMWKKNNLVIGLKYEDNTLTLVTITD